MIWLNQLTFVPIRHICRRTTARQHFLQNANMTYSIQCLFLLPPAK